jgi:hypothetical protein
MDVIPASTRASASLTKRGLIEGCPGVIKQILDMLIQDHRVEEIRGEELRTKITSACHNAPS